MNWHNRVFFLIAVLAMAVACPLHATDVHGMRVSAQKDRTRAVFELSGPVDYKLFQLKSPDRVVLDFSHTRLDDGFKAPGGDGLMKDVRTGHHGRHGERVVLDMKSGTHPRSFLLKPSHGKGYRLVVDLYPDSAAGRAITRRTAAAEVAGDRPVIVAVDPGHGGKDSGAIGPNGLKEKTVTLAIGKRLARLINAQKGMKAILTRKGDYYVPLEKRFEIAREHKADLFISIHANSCPHFCDARGASVWVLSTHGKESEAGRWLARSENASDLVGGVSLDNKSHTLAAVLLDLSQGASMQASHEVGHDVLASLGKISQLYRSKVEHANFVVLRSPDVPSILVETAFISSHRDERLLGSHAYRAKLAHAILHGVERYFRTTPPPGTWFALQRDKRLGIKVAAASKDGSMQSVATNDGAADADIQDLHRVSRGETLSSIAQQYGVSVRALKSANSMNSNVLRAGTVLAIPAS